MIYVNRITFCVMPASIKKVKKRSEVVKVWYERRDHEKPLALAYSRASAAQLSFFIS